MKKGFTLAEVLITLGIIGVIAAVTVPGVISNAQNQQNSAKVLKAFNVLKNLEQEARLAQNAPPVAWSWAAPRNTGTGIFDAYFNNLDILKDCGIAATGAGATVNCFGMTYVVPAAINAGANGATIVGATARKVQTADGISYAFVGTGAAADSRVTVFVDVNGSQTPNSYGRDLFVFYLTDTGIRPDGATGTPTATTATANLCATTADAGCTARVVSEGRINY
jgi:prepilin-type N-terminal cleavage/methylation domain-containing protein